MPYSDYSINSTSPYLENLWARFPSTSIYPYTVDTDYIFSIEARFQGKLLKGSFSHFALNSIDLNGHTTYTMPFPHLGDLSYSTVFSNLIQTYNSLIIQPNGVNINHIDEGLMQTGNKQWYFQRQ